MAAMVIVIILVISGTVAVLSLNQGKSEEPVVRDHQAARAWVDLTSISAGEVREEDRWGNVETFSGAQNGTLSYYHQVSFHQTDTTESVVLGGEVWCMVRGNTSGAVLLRYTPSIQGAGWNISFECYAPQAGDAIDATYGRQQIGLTATLIDRQGNALASVDLSYGTPGDNYVRLRDAGTGEVTNLNDVILPSATVKGPAEGYEPERYLVSFQSMGDQRCVVTVMHTSGVMVGRGVVQIPSSWGGAAQLVLSTTSTVLTHQSPDPAVPWVVDTHSGGWFVDDLACRGATASYPLAGPLYEYASEGAGVPTGVLVTGAPYPHATVTIGGKVATFNETTGRYEADLRMSVQWGRSVGYTVVMDGVVVNDTMALTMTSSARNALVSEWWNGWDWVSVFGVDDCGGPDSAIAIYKGYNHPMTAYVMNSGGSSRQTLTYPYLEIALHAPHDWEGGGTRFWADGVSKANAGMTFLKQTYDYASRWDAPANGGKGDTYISMANPGNKATYQTMYALYEAGIRIDGRSSDKGGGAPGNHTQVGSWYDPGGYDGTGAGWYSYQPIDLMDAARLLSWDGEQSWSQSFGLVNSVAESHGVLRVYGHPNKVIALPELLHWIDDPKTNYSRENWKATDGEVASYIYGRWSTDIALDPTRSDATTWTYNVSTADPTAAGYWKVPITIGIDVGGKKLKDVVVTTNERSVRLSDHTLKDLDGARIMDSGYDVRNGTLYVSGIWTGGARITVTFEEGESTALNLTPTTPLIIRVE
ncbi:MAG: hypothetical protein SA339_00090 [Methanomassiliicoccus sp.]|nr:hypothetical protein [Methanomassiliicoccus sp.]